MDGTARLNIRKTKEIVINESNCNVECNKILLEAHVEKEKKERRLHRLRKIHHDHDNSAHGNIDYKKNENLQRRYRWWQTSRLRTCSTLLIQNWSAKMKRSDSWLDKTKH